MSRVAPSASALSPVNFLEASSVPAASGSPHAPHPSHEPTPMSASSSPVVLVDGPSTTALPLGSKRPSSIASPSTASATRPIQEVKRIRLVSSSPPAAINPTDDQQHHHSQPPSDASTTTNKAGAWSPFATSQQQQQPPPMSSSSSSASTSSSSSLKDPSAVASPAGNIPTTTSSSSSSSSSRERNSPPSSSSSSAAAAAAAAAAAPTAPAKKTNTDPSSSSSYPAPSSFPSGPAGAAPVSRPPSHHPTVSILPTRPAPSSTSSPTNPMMMEPGLNKASLSDPLMGLQTILSEMPDSKGLGQLVTFAASTPIAAKDHTQLFKEVHKVLQREAEMRRDLVEFEEMMNLNPAACYYGKKPSAVFPDLDAEFPSHEYDEILFMRQFVSFMITRLQIVCGLCPHKSKEMDMVNSILRSWWQRSMDYL